jgi:uncharacterized C2H2 Zn-finger protein
VNETGPEWQQWVDAAKVLADDPHAQVRCPRNGDAYLEVIDIPLPGDPTQLERHLRCPACGATNIIRNPRGR